MYTKDITAAHDARQVALAAATAVAKIAKDSAGLKDGTEVHGKVLGFNANNISSDNRSLRS